jgi:hypothetical protein
MNIRTSKNSSLESCVAKIQKLTQLLLFYKKNTHTHRNTELHDTKSSAIIKFKNDYGRIIFEYKKKKTKSATVASTKIATTKLLISFL